MVAGFWRAEGRKVVKSSPFLTKRLSKRSNLPQFDFFKSKVTGSHCCYFRILSLWDKIIMGNLKFKKSSRLSSKKEIEDLFANGVGFNLRPIRIIHATSLNGTKTKTLFSVPSRNFKRAVDRNLLKRRMREAFRINQDQLDLPVKLNLAYIYIAKKIQPFPEIEKSIIESFKKLRGEVEK